MQSKTNRKATVSAGIVARWSGSYLPGTKVLRDATRHGHDGTLTDMTPSTDWGATNRGNALSFNGIDGFVTVPRVGRLLSTNSLSAMVWFRTTTTETFDRGMLGAVRGSGGNVSWNLSYSAGGYFSHLRASDGFHLLTASALGLNNGEWHSLALAASNGARQIYVDGLLHDADTYIAPIDTAEPTILLGKGMDGRFLEFTMREAAIWDRGLTTNEVYTLHHNPNILNTPSFQEIQAAITVVSVPTTPPTVVSSKRMFKPGMFAPRMFAPGMFRGVGFTAPRGTTTGYMRVNPRTSGQLWVEPTMSGTIQVSPRTKEGIGSRKL